MTEFSSAPDLQAYPSDLVIEDNLQRLEGVGVPPARELLGKLKEHEVPVYV